MTWLPTAWIAAVEIAAWAIVAPEFGAAGGIRTGRGARGRQPASSRPRRCIGSSSNCAPCIAAHWAA